MDVGKLQCVLGQGLQDCMDLNDLQEESQKKIFREVQPGEVSEMTGEMGCYGVEGLVLFFVFIFLGTELRPEDEIIRDKVPA